MAFIKKLSDTSGRSDQKLKLLDLLLQAEGLSAAADPIIPRRKNLEEFPLSFAQKRLWFLNHLEPGPHYNDHFNLRFQGPLQVRVLQWCVDEIVRRHEALRTRFVMEQGEPVQKLAAPFSVPLPVIDLSTLPELERMPAAMKLAVEEAQAPFNLQSGPLLRTKLLRLAELDYLLLLTVHHIAIDGWSRGVFLRELTTLYRAFAAGDLSPLAPLPIQYADFAVWQQQWMKDEVLIKQLSYWKQQLAGVPALLEWPADFPRPEKLSYLGARQLIRIPKALTEALAVLSQREGCTLFMTLLAAFQTLAARYTRQEDIVVGTPIANRNRAEIEGLIGGFVNTLVMRANLSGNPTFREVMARVRETALAAYAHQDLPFEKLVEELHPARNQSYHPIFQVMFIFQNAPMPVLKTANLSIQPFEIDAGAAKFDLTFNLEQTAEGLSGWIEYATDLFTADSITRFCGHYQMLLEGMVANVDQPIATLPITTADERRLLLETWNATNIDFPKTFCVHELFEQQAARTPDSVAVVCGEDRLTYAELNERANQLAHYLRRCGLGRGMLVGISMERSLEMLVGLFGILKAGGAYVPLDPAYPRERLDFMLQDAKASILLTQKCLVERSAATASGLQVICLDSGWKTIARESCENPAGVAQTDDLIYVIYTSGSTGRPKGVGVYHRGFTNLVHWLMEDFAINDHDRALMISSLSFDLTQKGLYAPLLRGGGLHLPPAGPYDPALLKELIERNRITLLNCTPSAFYPLIEPAQAAVFQKVASLRCAFLGGEPISIPRLRPWLESDSCRMEVNNTYGPTECTDIVAFYRMNRGNLDRFEFIPIGKPIHNVQLAIVNPEFALCPINVPGELCVGGTSVGAGYMNAPELTAARFVKNPFPEISGSRLYKTGDLTRYLPDGNIEFLGRLDHQVKIRGFRIELREIESALAGHPAIFETVVVVHHPVASNGDAQANSEPALVAYYLSHNGQPADAGELRRFLKEKLPDYMVPSAFVYLEKFPLSPNGKVDRKALPAPEHTRPELAASYVAPGSPLEKNIADIWASVLRLEKVGVQDNFFELGGHSLLMVQVHARLCEALKSNLSIVKLFQYPTIGSLARHLSQPASEAGTLTKAQERARLQRQALAGKSR